MTGITIALVFLLGAGMGLFLTKPMISLWARQAVDKERAKKRVFENIGPEYRVLIRAKLESYALRADGAEAKISVTDSTRDTSILLIKVPDALVSRFPAGSNLRFELVVDK